MEQLPLSSRGEAYVLTGVCHVYYLVCHMCLTWCASCILPGVLHVSYLV